MPTWIRVTSAFPRRHTVYWSCEDHPSGFRLAVAREAVKEWRWSIYMGHPKQTDRTLKVHEGLAATLHEARREASAWAEQNDVAAELDAVI